MMTPMDTLQIESVGPDVLPDDPCLGVVLEPRPSHGHQVRSRGPVDVRFTEHEPAFASTSPETSTRITVTDIESAIQNCVRSPVGDREAAGEALRRGAMQFLRQHSADMIAHKRELAGELNRLYRTYRDAAAANGFTSCLDYVAGTARHLDA